MAISEVGHLDWFHFCILNTKYLKIGMESQKSATSVDFISAATVATGSEFSSMEGEERKEGHDGVRSALKGHS